MTDREPVERQLAITLATMRFCTENQETVNEIVERAAMIYTWGGQKDMGDRALGVLMVVASGQRTPAMLVFAPPENQDKIKNIQDVIDGLIQYQNELRGKAAAKAN